MDIDDLEQHWHDVIDDVEHMAHLSVRHARRAIILVFGMTVLLIGAALLVLPGPGLLILALGLVILGVEFAWARVWLSRLRGRLDGLERRVRDGLHTFGLPGGEDDPGPNEPAPR